MPQPEERLFQLVLSQLRDLNESIRLLDSKMDHTFDTISGKFQENMKEINELRMKQQEHAWSIGLARWVIAGGGAGFLAFILSVVTFLSMCGPHKP